MNNSCVDSTVETSSSDTCKPKEVLVLGVVKVELFEQKNPFSRKPVVKSSPALPNHRQTKTTGLWRKVFSFLGDEKTEANKHV